MLFISIDLLGPYRKGKPICIDHDMHVNKLHIHDSYMIKKY